MNRTSDLPGPLYTGSGRPPVLNGAGDGVRLGANTAGPSAWLRDRGEYTVWRPAGRVADAVDAPVSFLNRRISRGATDPTGVTEEHLPGSQNASFAWVAPTVIFPVGKHCAERHFRGVCLSGTPPKVSSTRNTRV